MAGKTKRTITPAALCISVAAHALVIAALCVLVKRVVAPEPERIELVEVEVLAKQEEVQSSELSDQSPETVQDDKEEKEDSPEEVQSSEFDVQRSEEEKEEPANDDTEPEDPASSDEEPENVGEEQEASDEKPQSSYCSPAPKSSSNIAYPKRARRRGEEGDVTIELEIDARGAVSAARILKSSGSADLDAAALTALKNAVYDPATRDGAAVPGTLAETVKFRLRQ